jgi:hypothetical protein
MNLLKAWAFIAVRGLKTMLYIANSDVPFGNFDCDLFVVQYHLSVDEVWTSI